MVTITPLDYREWERQAHKHPKNIRRIDDDRNARCFTTWYAADCPIEKTVAHYAEEHYAEANDYATPGSVEVHMRAGEIYTFEAWATWWCATWGVNVSDDGERIYVISDLKGLRCHDREGHILWKNRYTSITTVLPHPDGTVTALTYNGNLYRFDEKGTVVKKRTAYDGRCEELVSDNLVALCTGDYTVTFFDTDTLEPVHKVPFRRLLEYLNCTAISEDHILLVGAREGREIPLPNGGRYRERLSTICLLDRRDNRVLRELDHTFLRENRLLEEEDEASPMAAYASLTKDRIILYPGARDGVSFRKIEIPIHNR